MRAFLKGKEGDLIRLAKDSDNVILGLIVADDGGQHDLSTATLDLILYTRPNRNVTASLTAPADTAADGTFSVTIADTAMDFGPGRYYGFVRRTLAGVIQWSNKSTIIDIF